MCSSNNDIFGYDIVGEKIAQQVEYTKKLLSEFETYVKSNELGRAEALIPDIVENGGANVDSLCEQLELAYVKQANSIREHTFDQIALTLPKLDLFSARLNEAGTREVTLSWKAPIDSKVDSFCLVRKEGGSPKTDKDGSVLFNGYQQSFVDKTIPIGVPCFYSLFSCYKGRVNKIPNILNSPIIYTPNIEKLKICIEGCSNYVIAKIIWKIPSYDISSELLLSLERFNRNNSKKIQLLINQMEFIDDDVVIGEIYRYELTLTVSGKKLDPIIREVTVKKLPELPNIKAYYYLQNDGRNRLNIEWPDGIEGICISAKNMEPRFYSRKDYGEREIFLPQNMNTDSVIIQAIRQFSTGKTVLGPISQVKSKDSKRTLYVSLEEVGKPTIKKFWQKKEWGIRVISDDYSLLTSINITIENFNEPSQTFTISSNEIKSGNLFKFPERWKVKSGTTIYISLPSNIEDVYYIKYQTSPIIP